MKGIGQLKLKDRRVNLKALLYTGILSTGLIIGFAHGQTSRQPPSEIPAEIGSFESIRDAVRSGNLKQTEHLLAKRPSLIKSTDKDQYTLLHHAAEAGESGIATALIDRNIQIDLLDEFDRTPLSIAALEGHDEVVKVLLSRGASVDIKNKGGLTPLMVAAYSGNASCVSLLLDYGADINSPNPEGITPLYEAIVEGHLETSAILIKKGANVNFKTRKKRNTPLHKASFNGQTSVVELLLMNGAIKEARASNGSTPLHRAALGGHTAVVELLLKHGAKVNSKRKRGDTRIPVDGDWVMAHQNALQLNKSEDAEIYKAYFHPSDRPKSTPLHIAAREGHDDVVALLLKHGAKINATTDKTTVLHHAVESGSKETVKLLLSQGANVKAKDARGATPVDWAEERKRLGIVDWVEERERLDILNLLRQYQ